MKYLIIITFIFTGYSVQAQDYFGDTDDITQILSAIEDFSDAYVKADYERLVSHYTNDARILPPGAGIIQGREAIQKRWTLPENVKILAHKTTPHELRILGNYAYDVGIYEGETQRPDQTTVTWKGKYIIVWQKVDDQWLIYADAWNRTDE